MRDLTKGGEAGLILRFTLPMLLGNAFQQLYNWVDSVVVGNFVGEGALAAVGAGFPVLFLLVSLVMGITMGIGIVLSQCYGAKDMEKVRRAIDTAWTFMAVASLALTVAGLLAARPLLVLLDTPAEVLGDASDYLSIIFAGMAMMFGYNMSAAILRALGDSRRPLYAVILATVVNIALDLLFVAGFGWGVRGVAWATVIAQGISFIALFLYVNARHPEIRVDFRNLRPDGELFRQSLRLGLPGGVQQMLVAGGMMAITRMINAHGVNAMAAFTAGSRVDSFASLPAMTISQALATFTGQNVGAGRNDRVKKGYRASMLMALGIAAAMTVLIVVFGAALMRLFNPNPEVVAIGRRYLVVVSLFYPLFCAMFVTNGLLRGAGAAFVPMANTILALWVVRVPVAALLQPAFGLDGIWYSIPAGWFVGAAFTTIYYLSGRWKDKAVVKARPDVGVPPE